ncbi:MULTISPECIES: hypothetical protein [Acinetobacter]|uniref:Uncharacterized protein n=1 Tax=Acinetobacter nosocomialis NIPH 386 TaxID=1217985 RepID=A0AAV3IQL2_ACINO|nr:MULTISPECIES: hypothetical protein [Acinetobacter]AZC01623.1 hypothetical protein DKC18_000895 [Acinetobacter nosocomialis]AZC03821.1 hypothetical protein DKE50_000960 [Acinetobacter nosocomialis]AZC05516.1 hypothetical protein DKE44_000940 [Acinetobacter nosocomialis]EKU50989.1 hypothetical protein ACINWC487_3807 [Acinetobacter nosocomialis]ENV41965.1 hypothetical protein F958_01099 [Acinetobacter nosocomialis NIPH 386]
MLGFLKIMLPLLLIVFLLMGLWVSILHFPWEWMTYVVMGFEVFVATLILPFEYQAGTSSSSIGFIHISAYFAVILGIARLVVWAWVKFVT